jgi:hypothetical protein
MSKRGIAILQLTAMGLGLPACVSSELKGAVGAYAVAVEHETVSSKKLLAECIAPPQGLSEDDRKAECSAASEGFDAILKSAQALDTAVTGGSSGK